MSQGLFNPALNAIVAWQTDRARERACAADGALARGETRGPLHSVPMTVKESFDVAVLPSTWGNPRWKDHIATGNAVLVVHRPLPAGCGELPNSVIPGRRLCPRTRVP
jgi:amidase